MRGNLLTCFGQLLWDLWMTTGDYLYSLSGILYYTALDLWKQKPKVRQVLFEVQPRFLALTSSALLLLVPLKMSPNDILKFKQLTILTLFACWCWNVVSHNHVHLLETETGQNWWTWMDRSGSEIALAGWPRYHDNMLYVCLVYCKVLIVSLLLLLTCLFLPSNILSVFPPFVNVNQSVVNTYIMHNVKMNY